MGTKDLFADFKFTLGAGSLSKKKQAVLGFAKPKPLEPKLFARPRDKSWGKGTAKSIKKPLSNMNGKNTSISAPIPAAKKRSIAHKNKQLTNKSSANSRFQAAEIPAQSPKRQKREEAVEDWTLDVSNQKDFQDTEEVNDFFVAYSQQ